MRIRHWFVVFILTWLCLSHQASGAEWEVHPGIFASYERTDNYFGSAHNTQDETSWVLGPSLSLSARSAGLSWDLSGYFAHSRHEEFDDDDSNESRLETTLDATGEYGAVSGEYLLVHTQQRETLDDPQGTTRTQTGGLSWYNQVAPAWEMSLSSRWDREDNPRPEEDIIAYGMDAGVESRFSVRHTARMVLGYDSYDYDESADSEEQRLEMDWRVAHSPRLRWGPEAYYVRADREGLPDVTTLRISLGGSWELSPLWTSEGAIGVSYMEEDSDSRQDESYVRVLVEYSGVRDQVELSARREHESEYSTDRNGFYRITEGAVTWHRQWNIDVVSDARLGRTRRVPSAALLDDDEDEWSWGVSLSWQMIDTVILSLSYDRVDTEYDRDDGLPLQADEEDKVTGIALLWTPWRQGEARIYYQYLAHEIDRSPAETENRYGMTVGVTW